MTIDHNEVGDRRGWLWIWAGVAIALATTSWARADSGSLSGPGLQQPTSAAELGDAAQSIADVEQAVKSFGKREFDACLKELAQARTAHPELPPQLMWLSRCQGIGSAGRSSRLSRISLTPAVSSTGAGGLWIWAGTAPTSGPYRCDAPPGWDGRGTAPTPHAQQPSAESM